MNMKNQESNKVISNIRIIFAIAWKDILDGWKNKVILTSVITSLFLIIFYMYLPEITMGDELPLMVILDQDKYIQIEETGGIEAFNIRLVDKEKDFLYLLRDLETPVIGIILEQDPDHFQVKETLSLQGYYPYWMKASQIYDLETSAEVILGNYWELNIDLTTKENVVYPVMDNYSYGKTFVATAGLLIQITLMGLSMAPQLIVAEKDSKTLQAIMISPVNLGQFILGKTIAVFFYTGLTTTIGLFFVGPLIINWGITLAGLAIGMVSIITPGILLGVLFQNKQQISIWIWVVFIPTMLPLFFSVVRIFPENLMKIIDWWPIVALSRLLRAGFTYQPPFNTYRMEGIYLLIYTLIFFSLTLLVIRRQTFKGA